MQDEFERFLEYLKVSKNFSPHTVLAYQADLEQFKDFLLGEFPEISGLIEVRQNHVRNWIAHLAESGLSPRSIRRKRSALSRFFKFLLSQGLAKQNPVTGTAVPKMSSRIVQFYDEKSLRNVAEAGTIDDDFPALRDLLIIELLYGTGMRRAELCNLLTANVDILSRQIKVLGKGNKERIIPITAALTEIICFYLPKREALYPNAELLLLDDKGRPLSGAIVYRKVKTIMSNHSSLAKNSPHVLRHSYATHLLAGGADLNAVKELLGHSSLAATQVYTHVSIGGLLEAYRKAHPKS